MHASLPTSFSSPARLCTLTYAKPPAGLAIHFDDLAIGHPDKKHCFYVLTCRHYLPVSSWDATIAPVPTGSPRPPNHILSFGTHPVLASYEYKAPSPPIITSQKSITHKSNLTGDVDKTIKLPASPRGSQQTGGSDDEQDTNTYARAQRRSLPRMMHRVGNVVVKIISTVHKKIIPRQGSKFKFCVGGLER